MLNPLSLFHRFLRLMLLAFIPAAIAFAAPRNLNELKAAFENPPDDSRIMMRWWWFGPAVTQPEIERELVAMKAGGIGGFELAVVNPIALDDPAKNIRNVPYLSADFLEDLRFTGQKAKDLGLRMDLTLGSGWPFGNPGVTVEMAAKNLRLSILCVPADPFQRTPVIPPALGDGEELIGIIHPESSEPRFLISSPTRLKNVAAAFESKGWVLDHYRREAIEQHLRTVGEPMLAALSATPPYAVFSDSLEVARADWTPGFLAEFKRRRGYDLTPFLPALIEDIGEKTGAIRHDWGQTLTELANDNYLSVIGEWAKKHQTRFRSQTYGTPPVTLSSNALIYLPEGELGFYWRQFSPARWASSASHLYGKPVTSTETWTWLHSPVFRATPLDLKAEADLHFIQGVNQLIGHGWPYSAPTVDEPGWSFYAAGNFSDHNPWWPAMPSLSRYLQRVSFLLRQGQPANDVALYLPTADIYAGFTASNDESWDHVSVSRAIDKKMGWKVVPQILDAGFNFDYIDDGAINQVGIPYRILVLANVERIPLATYRRIADFVAQGGILIATQRRPQLAPGLLEAPIDGPEVVALSELLFGAKGSGRFVPDAAELGTALRTALAPDLDTVPGIGFVHRKLPFADVYFVVNTDNRPVRALAVFRTSRSAATAWNPVTGKTTAGAEGNVTLELAPYESRVFVFSDSPLPESRPQRAGPTRELDLSRGWEVKIGDREPVVMDRLRSWTEEEATRYYSGTAVYRKSVTVPAAMVASADSLVLNFGEGKPLPTRASFGMHALLESPIREVAMVYVNDQWAGAVWAPPYEVEVTSLLRAGENQLRVVVGNLAINAIAGKPLPDYRAVKARYQSDIPERYYGDDDLRHPLPSGLLGSIHLIAK